MGVVRGSIPRESNKNVQFIQLIPSINFCIFFWCGLPIFLVQVLDASVEPNLSELGLRGAVGIGGSCEG
jgi:hypothetical protein